jgi:non-canonical (house-cleaning) NTP pyrophosphatase
MKKITIAVGSLRRPKLNAVWEAVNVIGPTLDPNAQFEVVGAEVPSGVSHTPLSRAEVMAGARQRAEAVVRIGRERGEAWSYFVGLEGGLDVISDAVSGSGTAGGADAARERAVFLVSWAYVTDGTGRGCFGQAGGIALPEALAARVVDQGVELAEAIDAFAGTTGVRDAQGAWGVLTNNLITRQDVFRTAVINAFAPFFNAELYP